MSKFVKKTRSKIFKEINAEMKKRYGYFPEVSSLGQWRKVVTDRIYLLWEKLEEINNLKEGE